MQRGRRWGTTRDVPLKSTIHDVQASEMIREIKEVSDTVLLTSILGDFGWDKQLRLFAQLQLPLRRNDSKKNNTNHANYIYIYWFFFHLPCLHGLIVFIQNSCLEDTHFCALSCVYPFTHSNISHGISIDTVLLYITYVLIRQGEWCFILYILFLHVSEPRLLVYRFSSLSQTQPVCLHPSKYGRQCWKLYIFSFDIAIGRAQYGPHAN